MSYVISNIDSPLFVEQPRVFNNPPLSQPSEIPSSIPPYSHVAVRRLQTETNAPQIVENDPPQERLSHLTQELQARYNELLIANLNQNYTEGNEIVSAIDALWSGQLAPTLIELFKNRFFSHADTDEGNR